MSDSDKEEKFTDGTKAKPGDIWVAKFFYMSRDNMGRSYGTRPVYVYAKLGNKFRVIEITTQSAEKKKNKKGEHKKYMDYMYDLTKQECEKLKLKDFNSSIRCADVCDVLPKYLKFRVCEYDDRSLIHKYVRRQVRDRYLAAIKDGALQHTIAEQMIQLYREFVQEEYYRNMIRNIKFV